MPPGLCEQVEIFNGLTFLVIGLNGNHIMTVKLASWSACIHKHAGFFLGGLKVDGLVDRVSGRSVACRPAPVVAQFA